jgi:hypothetical protein
MYFGESRRWPEPAPGVFELFATHPHASTDPGDLTTRYIRDITTWDGDGTVKLYTAYGSISANVAPIYVTPLSLGGTWSADAWAFNAYEMQKFVHWSDGQMMACGGDGPSDWFRARPSVSGAPPVYIDGWCSPKGFIHPMTMVEHDGYMWVSGASSGPGGGAVWRGTHETGNDGAFVLQPLIGWFNSCMFSFQSKLWFQEEGGTQLKYWVEASDTWVATGVNVGDGNCQYRFPWGSVMLLLFGGKLYSFNGTALTERYGTGDVGLLTVDADSNVWVYESDTQRFRMSSDLTTWTTKARFPTSEYIASMYVYEDLLYMGDTHSQIWRTQI